MTRKPLARLAILGTVLLSVGCTSQWTTVVPRPPQDYETLGRATGTATGRMFFDGTALNFIPVGLNSRTEQAYRNALASVPGATALVNVTIQERWASWYLWSSKTVTVSGDAVRSR
ncbi:MAG: hypothetical protein ACYTG2_09155 [Planctomycetota bacterium]|jgi:hypothetical protein